MTIANLQNYRYINKYKKIKKIIIGCIMNQANAMKLIQ